MLVKYCHPDCAPLKNIMRLPKSEAFALAASFAKVHPGTTAFYRFADFDALFAAADRQYIEAQLWSDKYFTADHLILCK